MLVKSLLLKEYTEKHRTGYTKYSPYALWLNFARAPAASSQGKAKPIPLPPIPTKSPPLRRAANPIISHQPNVCPIRVPFLCPSVIKRLNRWLNFTNLWLFNLRERSLNFLTRTPPQATRKFKERSLKLQTCSDRSKFVWFFFSGRRQTHSKKQYQNVKKKMECNSLSYTPFIWI